ncbi:MAG: hypothetical protein WCL23_00695 [Candidatus Moraniibacteriota bacterium]
MQQIIDLLGLIGIKLTQEMRSLLVNGVTRLYQTLVLWVLAIIMLVPVAIFCGANGWNWVNLTLFVLLLPCVGIAFFTPANVVFMFLFGGAMCSLSDASRQRFLAGGEAYVKGSIRLIGGCLLVLETILFYLGFVDIKENPWAVVAILIVAIFITLDIKFGGRPSFGKKILYIVVPSLIGIVAAVSLIKPGTWTSIGLPAWSLADHGQLNDVTARIGKQIEENRIAARKKSADSLYAVVESGKRLSPAGVRLYHELIREGKKYDIVSAAKQTKENVSGNQEVRERLFTVQLDGTKEKKESGLQDGEHIFVIKDGPNGRPLLPVYTMTKDFEGRDVQILFNSYELQKGGENTIVAMAEDGNEVRDGGNITIQGGTVKVRLVIAPWLQKKIDSKKYILGDVVAVLAFQKSNY